MKRTREFPRIAAMLTAEPWMIHPAKLASMIELLEAHASGKADITAYEESSDEDEQEEWIRRSWYLSGKVAVVPLEGVIGKRLRGFALMCGGLCLDRIETLLRVVMADARVQAVVLDWDSPGGAVTGVHELATLIKEMTAEKTIVSYTSNVMCSAAYYLASSCDYIISMRSATVGSVGTIWAGEDNSKRFSQEGREAVIAASGSLKPMGRPGVAYTEEMRAHMDAIVEEHSQEFFAHVRDCRPGISEEVFETAGFWMGDKLLELALVDSFLPNLEQVVEELNDSLNGEF